MSYTVPTMKVKKEATVAVVIGLILALVVTGGVIRARTALKTIKLPTRESFTRSKPSDNNAAKSAELFLDFTIPDNLVTDKDKLTLSGKTMPGTYIAILGERAEYLIVPNELGAFSQDILLIKGANTIKITVYEKDGKKIEKTLNAVYTTAEL